MISKSRVNSLINYLTELELTVNNTYYAWEMIIEVNFYVQSHTASK